MAEAVRLVIWDLDDTFWRGTLSEGGIDEYLQSNHDMIIELARRGIISSICSKNDFQAVMDVLERHDIARYFVFPSISWSSKGSRLIDIVDSVQLRPATIMFIDDNHLNRAEAQLAVPQMQVESEEFLLTLLEDSRFIGKDDHTFSRLQQYKLLEKKKLDAEINVGNNEDFLRTCNIMISIDLDVEKNIDRAVELINRTNQLNFTKLRLPEEPGEARIALRRLLDAPNTQAGLVSAYDKYGDYGYVGFYLLNTNSKQLQHYCWSCRTLGMLAEVWLYRKLGSPIIEVQGEVLSDLKTDRKIDWIKLGKSPGLESGPNHLGRIFLRGGCDMSAVAHFLRLGTSVVVGEFNIDREGRPIRLDHSAFLGQAIQGLTERELLEAAQVGYRSEDFSSEMLTQLFDIYIFSFWSDINHATYSTSLKRLSIPFSLHQFDNQSNILDGSKKVEIIEGEVLSRQLAALRSSFEFDGIDIERMQRDVKSIMSHTAGSSLKIVIEACEKTPSGSKVFHHHKVLNDSIRGICSTEKNVVFVKIDECIADDSQVLDNSHFNRMVYASLAQNIVKTIERFRACEGAMA